MTTHAIVDDYGSELEVVEVDEDAEYVLAPAIGSLIDLWLQVSEGNCTSFTVYANGEFTLYRQNGFIRGNLHTMSDAQ
jgi:hypothetical protein